MSLGLLFGFWNEVFRIRDMEMPIVFLANSNPTIVGRYVASNDNVWSARRWWGLWSQTLSRDHTQASVVMKQAAEFNGRHDGWLTIRDGDDPAEEIDWYALTGSKDGSLVSRPIKSYFLSSLIHCHFPIHFVSLTEFGYKTIYLTNFRPITPSPALHRFLSNLRERLLWRWCLLACRY